MRAHAVLLRNQTGGRVHQPGGGAYIFGLAFEHFLEGFEQRLGVLLRGFYRLLFFLVLQLAQIDRALGHALQRGAIEFVQEAQGPLIHAVGHEQHFDAFFAEDFELRTVAGGGQGIGGDVVDGFLAFFHARLVA